MTRAAASGATVRTVLRKSVTPRILAKAFGLPSRAEKPADRTTRRTPATAFVGIISRMTIPANLQRRPFLAPIGLVAITLAAGIVILIAAVWFLVTSTSTTVILVRHAPQMLGINGDDPPLSAEGEARAASLARLLGDTHLKSRVAAIYVSEKLRSRSTAAPLAQMLGITPVVVDEDDARGLARRVLRDHPGETILIVGHANTLPAIVADLSGMADIPPVEPSDYATVYVVTVPRVGRAGVVRLRY